VLTPCPQDGPHRGRQPGREGDLLRRAGLRGVPRAERAGRAGRGDDCPRGAPRHGGDGWEAPRDGRVGCGAHPQGGPAHGAHPGARVHRQRRHPRADAPAAGRDRRLHPQALLPVRVPGRRAALDRAVGGDAGL
ncbi:MAG: hypothetical protein AVDCRST_MAG68-3527, partial [uncultured Gemmatimonadetes bacterium]